MQGGADLHSHYAMGLPRPDGFSPTQLNWVFDY
jgi:hypothetical protein